MNPDRATSLHLYIGKVKGGVITSGSAALFSAMGFLPEDVGLPLWVLGAGASGGNLITTIAVVTDSAHVTLSDAAGTDTADGQDNNVILFREVQALFGTLHYTEEVMMRDTLDFVVDTEVGDAPVVGLPILLRHDDYTPVDRFGGSIEQARTSNVPGNDFVRTEVSCNNWDALLSKRTTGLRSYGDSESSPPVSVTAGDVITDLIPNTMGADFIGVVIDEDSPTPLPTISFDYEPVLSALQRIARQVSNDIDTYFAKTDVYRVLHFGKQTTNPAPWTISDLDGSDENARIQVHSTESREKLANRVFVKGTQVAGDEVTESYPGDGSSRDFRVNSAVRSTPAITVNGTPKTVGPSGATGFDWYWSDGSNILTQDAGGTILTSSDTFGITYQPFGDGIVLYSNAPAVLARAAIEGGTGYYETVHVINVRTTLAEMSQLAEALAKKYGSKTIQAVEILTGRPGLAAGQLITLHLTELGVDGDFLIESSSMVCDDSNAVTWSIKAIGSPLIGDWRKALADLPRDDTDTRGGSAPQIVAVIARAVLPGIQVTGTDQTANHLRITTNLNGQKLTLTHAYVTAKIPPVSVNYSADYLVSIDGGATWNSVFPSGTANKAVLPTGQRTATITPAWAIPTLHDGDFLRVDVLAADGTVSGVEVVLYGGIS